MNRTEAVNLLNQLLTPVDRYESERWITIGAKSGPEGKKSGGTPVKLDGSGHITSGPSALQGKTISTLKAESTPKPQVQQAAKAATHNVGLPKDKKRLSIDQAHSALKQMGYSDIVMLQPTAANGWRPRATVKNPAGETVELDADQIKKIVYDGFAPRDSYSLAEQLIQVYYDRAAGEPHHFSCSLIHLPKPIAAEVLKLGASIPDADLAADARETEPHVTVKFGTHTSNPDDVRRIVRSFGPVRITLGETSLFPAKEPDAQRGGDSYDVVKIDVNSPDLHRLNRMISDALPHTDTHPAYKPHVTLAYVKPGLGKKYVGKNALSGKSFTADVLQFSDTERKQTDIPLGISARPQSPSFSRAVETLNRLLSPA